MTTKDIAATPATIEIRTLTIGPRRLSHGIYKQLIEAPLIAEDGTLRGTPWGHVNHCLSSRCGIYFSGMIERWDDCHRHVIWQTNGGQLRRSKVWSLGALPATWAQVDSRPWSGLGAELQERHRAAHLTVAQLPQLFIGG